MLKANRRTLIITSIVALIPMLIGAVLWDRLPERMATHFGLNGQPDGFTGRAFMVFGMPLLLVALEWVGAFVTAHDPRRQNISGKMFKLVLWSIPVISLFLAATVYPYNLGLQVDIGFYAQLFLGAMFVILGNYMPKARQNYTIGIRVPWTLADEDNWNRTHRLAGWLWTATGVVLLVLTLCGIMRAGWLVAAIVAATAVPVGYSFWLHCKK